MTEQNSQRRTSFLTRLARDESGAAIVEMAILAPVLIAMLLGVLQVGFYMQAQNALRGIGAETSRETAVLYQTNNRISNTQIEDLAFRKATYQPYLLRSDRLDIYAADASSTPFAGARQIELRLVYDVPNIMGFSGVPLLTLNYTRSIFVPATPVTAT